MKISPRSRKKAFRNGAILVGLLFSFLVIFLPTFLSSPFANQVILKAVNDQIDGRIEMQNFTLNWSGKQQMTKLKLLNLDGSLILSCDSLEMNASLADLLKDALEGAFKKDPIDIFNELNLSFQAKGVYLSDALLEQLSLRKEMSSIFGTEIEMEVEGNIQNQRGHIRANLAGNSGHAFLNAHIENDSISLIEPFSLTTTLTNEFNKKILSEALPFFNELIATQGKIKLTISHENTSFPLKNFNWDSFQIKNAIIDAGLLMFENKGAIKKLVDSLHPAKSDTISMWTTPLHLSIENGVLNMKRFDMLIMNKYPIAMWGKINFIKDKVNMTIGLTGTALSQALDLEGLDKNTIIQVPLRGSVNNVKVDSSKTTAKIGALVAKNGSGPGGFLLGAALGLISGKEEKAPPPTTTPFPWSQSEKRVYLTD